jgi:dTDP-4-dehydrorhamnose reductase
MMENREMRVLIFGAEGMLGHKLYQVFSGRYEVFGTFRTPFAGYKRLSIFRPESIIDNLDVGDFDRVIRAISKVRPNVVINCIGIIKQLKEAKDPLTAIKVNALWPHQLASLCCSMNARLFHISTDCVFSGKGGMYTEESVSDAEDLYGRTKYLGEVAREGCLTLRTSIIGRELSTTNSLVEWFLSNRDGKVKGFQRAIYSGFTTVAMADIIADLIIKHPDLHGLYHVSSEPIDKFSLLQLIKKYFNLSVIIEPEQEMHIDRSLNSARFREKTGFKPPSWEQMISQLAADRTPYDRWRSTA